MIYVKNYAVFFATANFSGQLTPIYCVAKILKNLISSLFCFVILALTCKARSNLLYDFISYLVQWFLNKKSFQGGERDDSVRVSLSQVTIKGYLQIAKSQSFYFRDCKNFFFVEITRCSMKNVTVPAQRFFCTLFRDHSFYRKK